MKLFPAKCRLLETWRKQCCCNKVIICFYQFDPFFFRCITNHLMTGPLGNSDFSFLRISRFLSTSSRETLKFSKNKIYCSLYVCRRDRSRNLDWGGRRNCGKAQDTTPSPPLPILSETFRSRDGSSEFFQRKKGPPSALKYYIGSYVWATRDELTSEY